MSTLQHSLDLLGFKSFDELSGINLKKAFKIKVLNAHPDKGGADDEFDALLGAYIQLTETTQRINGGRHMLGTVSAPEDLKERWANEIINDIFDDIYSGLSREEFHKKYEETHEKDVRGYSSWLSNVEEGSSTLINPLDEYPKIKPPTFPEAEFNKVFEDTTIMGSKIDSSDTLIIHPDQMATVSGRNLGVSLIDDNTGTFTSMLNERPEYTDTYSAFTHDNTITDKVKFIEDTSRPKTLEELIAQRDTEILPVSVAGYEAYAAYEKKKFEEELEYRKKLRGYYESSNSDTNIKYIDGGYYESSDNDTDIKYIDDNDNNGFICNFSSVNISDSSSKENINNIIIE